MQATILSILEQFHFKILNTPVISLCSLKEKCSNEKIPHGFQNEVSLLLAVKAQKNIRSQSLLVLDEEWLYWRG